MKNTLHKSMESWFATRKGHIPFWQLTDEGQVLLGHTGDINFLIEMANRYLDKGDLKKMTYISFEHMFGYALSVWMERFVKEGFSSRMLHDLRDELRGIRFYHFLNPAIPSRGKPLPHWEYHADMDDFDDPNTTAAYAFSEQLTTDGFINLKRCQLDGCKQFFTGRPNAKWCSDTCGSKFRVMKKRRKDRQ